MKTTKDDLFNSIRERAYGEPKKLLHTALVLKEGWEMDNEGWVVRMSDGTIRGFTTSHGGVYPWDEKELNDSLEETARSLKQLQKAKELLNESKTERFRFLRFLQICNHPTGTNT